MKKILYLLMSLLVIVYVGVSFCYSQTDVLENPEAIKQVAPVEKQAESAEEEKMELTVAEAQVGTGIENRRIVGESTNFSSSIERIYCASFIKGATSPTTIKHLWYYQDKKMAEVPLEIKYSTFRTWSYKGISPQWIGAWRVEIVDVADKVLKVLDFEVTESAEESQDEKEPAGISGE